MKLGAIFPTPEIGNDPAAVRDWAQAAEDLGYDHIITYDHVLGAVHEGRDPALVDGEIDVHTARRQPRLNPQTAHKGPARRRLAVAITIAVATTMSNNDRATAASASAPASAATSTTSVPGVSVMALASTVICDALRWATG